MSVSDDDLEYLRRCVELAREALIAGDEPFGSVLIDDAGRILFEDRNRVKDGDNTRHPELTIALWAVHNVAPEDRARATVYTSGEHCPMCSAAHAWVGLGRIVYAVSSTQLSTWLHEWGAPPSPVAGLSINTVAPGLVVDGPAGPLEAEMKALHWERFKSTAS
ncbi:nucleoside deaminase [Williamsia sp. 1135]|uniref:nucleoside deaminase n=1 Tax=Williamsia sp. 1135 TaxID=1889262 RepID=UPI000A11221B|nr:nucleoside deaminase [Williamsia sp. 1135]ORM36458.1 tRNA-specific adenosine deaminase [Williamsia sp. 1135]